MLLQIEKSVKAEAVEEQILSAIPEWDLRPGYVIIGTYGSVEKQEQDLLQSVGSPTSDIPYGSEFRFAKDNLLLKRIWVNAPEENRQTLLFQAHQGRRSLSSQNPNPHLQTPSFSRISIS